MTCIAKGPPPGQEGGPIDVVCLAANDQEINQNRSAMQVRNPLAAAAMRRARLRRQRHVEHLHRLGPSPLGHFIREIEAGAGIDATLLRYSEVPVEFVRALGGDRFAPLVHVIDGGEP